MDDIRFGNAIRTMRIRRRLRQTDLAELSRVSRAAISRIERGHVGSLTIDGARRVAAALDVRVDLVPRWRGGDFDRLLNARHSQLHELVAQRFATLDGWTTAPEVSFAIFGERGVVDLLAQHRATGALLVIELKTEIVDVNELIGTLDRKRRLAPQIAHDHGWNVTPAAAASAWLIVSEGRTNRRRFQAHRAVLRSAFPFDGRSIAGWLRDPTRPMSALSFWSGAPMDNGRPSGPAVRRVRRVRRGASPTTRSPPDF